ncbi:MAG: hypothetical protein HKN25_14380 [Pyrinomonadaceae bacterium]|nr:hypothetical protein [Pyrinomonadaceae bacterium]
MKGIFVTISLVCAVFAVSVFAQDEIIFQSDFEKGTQPWEKRGASIGTTKKEAAGGKKSLRVSGRRDTWQGAQLNVTKLLQKGKQYKFTVSVKLAKKQSPDEIKMTMERGNNNYSQIAAANANADGWTTISGSFSPTGSDPYLLLYLEAAGARTSYFLDDFKIEGASLIPKQEGLLHKSDFEDFTAQDWIPFGNGVQMFSSKPLGSSRGIRIAGRSKSTDGIALDLSPKFYKDRTYKLSISVRLTKGQKPDSLRLGVQQTAPDGKKTYVEVAPYKEATDADWITLEGDYSVTTLGNNLLIVVQAKGATTSFLIDNFELSAP